MRLAKKEFENLLLLDVESECMHGDLRIVGVCDLYHQRTEALGIWAIFSQLDERRMILKPHA